MQKEVGIIEAKFQRRWDVYMCSCSLCIGFKDQTRGGFHMHYKRRRWERINVDADGF